jgi:hypothetical protein
MTDKEICEGSPFDERDCASPTRERAGGFSDSAGYGSAPSLAPQDSLDSIVGTVKDER